MPAIPSNLRHHYLLALRLVLTCSQSEDTRQGDLLSAGGLLRGAALFLLQRPCLLETHYSFLFVHISNNQLKWPRHHRRHPDMICPVSSLSSPRRAVQQGPLPCLVDECLAGRGQEKKSFLSAWVHVPDGSQHPGETRTSFSNVDSGLRVNCRRSSVVGFVKIFGLERVSNRSVPTTR